jgi:D-glycero-alpha-D-manno-heptose 1-phosphate guanylyltransferase
MREAIILAGGMGTRLKSVVPDLPKVMAPVAGRPFLTILLESLMAKKFSRIILSLGYKAEMIESHFGGSFGGMELIYEIETVPLGTGGAIRRSLARCEADPVFVFNGDTFVDFEIDELEFFWRAHQCPVIVAQEVADTSAYGRLDIRDGRIVSFFEKDVSGNGFISAGLYVLPRNYLNHMPEERFFSFETDVLAKRVKDDDVRAFLSKGFYIDIGTPDHLKRAQTVFARKTK